MSTAVTGAPASRSATSARCELPHIGICEQRFGPTGGHAAMLAARLVAGRPPLEPLRRAAHDETGGELDMERLEALVVEQAGQEADRHPAHLGERLAHGRERGCDVLR